MLFVDGENLVARAQVLAPTLGVSLVRGPFYVPDVFVWAPRRRATERLPFGNYPFILQKHAVRAFYFTGIQGDDHKIAGIRSNLRDLGFQPEVFKRTSGKSKGVDIALSKEMLLNAFMGNYETAVLLSGDADYLPLIHEVKRLGKLVYVGAFSSGLSPNLRVEADNFCDLDHWLGQWWQGYTPDPTG